MVATWSWRSSPTNSERLTVARVLSAKGLSGAVRVEVLTDWPERLQVGAQVWIEGDPEPRRVTHAELGGRVPILRLDGIQSREAAEAIGGRHLEAERRSLPEGEYYWHELEGLRVTDTDGAELGRLAEVFRAGGAEVYRIVGPEGEHLIPALRNVVRGIDLDAGVMVVSLPDAEPEEVH